MPKKNMSDAERKAWADKMLAARNAKAAANKPKVVIEKDVPLESTDAPNVEESTVTSGDDMQNVLKRALEAIETLAKLQNAGNGQNGPQLNNQGRVIGTLERYAIDPALYPSPVERLKSEPKLQRFAFPINYDLNYTVSTTSYETKDGMNMIEPKFKLELSKIIVDDETGEPTNGRYTICRMTMHEDPNTALIVARENGVNIDDYDQQVFLNEMRYLQMRDWLLECFYPVKAQPSQHKREMVIDGKIVEYYEINSEQSRGIPFKDLSTRV